MSVHIGPVPPGDRLMPRSPRGDVRGRYRGLSRAYSKYLFDYAQEFLGNEIAATDVVQAALAAAAARSDQARSAPEEAGPGEADRAGADQLGADAAIRPELYAAVRRDCVARRAGWARGAKAGDLNESVNSGLLTGAVQRTGSSAHGSSATGSARAQEAVAEALTAEFAPSDLDAEDRRRHVLVVRQVLGGLGDSDVEILSLSVRHGLAEDGLSTVFAIPPRRAHAWLSAATEKFVQLAETTVLLSAGWSGCKKLDRLVGGSYPSAPDEHLCRRVTRHSRSCGTCGPIVATRGFGPELLSILSIPDLPPAVARRLDRAPGPDPAPEAPPAAAQSGPERPGPQRPGPQQSGVGRASAGLPPFPPVLDPVTAASLPGSPAAPVRTDIWARTESAPSGSPDAGGAGGAGGASAGAGGAGAGGPAGGLLGPGVGSRRRGGPGRGGPVQASPDQVTPGQPGPGQPGPPGQGRHGFAGGAPEPESTALVGLLAHGHGRDDAGPDAGDRAGGQPGGDDSHGPGWAGTAHRRPQGEPWLTPVRAGVLAAVAVMVIVGGAVTASKLLSGSPGGSGVPSAQNTSSAPGSQPSGTAPSSSGTTAHARSSGNAGSTERPSHGIVPGQSYYPSSSATATSGSASRSPTPRPSSPTPRPSSPKPKPSSSSPKPKPSSSSPSPTPTTTTPTPTPTP